MFTRCFLILVLFLSTFSTFAQELALVRENDMFGYINTDGDYVIKPQFVNAKNFSGSLAAAMQNKKWGFINTSGKWAIEPQYDKVKEFNSGYALVLKNDKWDYIDTSNAILNTPVQEKYYDFDADGIAFYRIGKKLGLLGTDGKIIMQPTYDVIKPFVEGYARVRNGDYWGMIKKDGSVFIPLEYAEIGDYSVKGVWAKKGETFGVIAGGTFNSTTGIDKIWDFTNDSDLTYARMNKKVGFINNKGEWVIQPIYRKVRGFNNGLAPALKEKSWGYINEKGDVITGFIFRDAETFSDDGLAPVKENKLWGFIDKTGKVVIPAEYVITAGGLSLFSKGNLKGFQDGLARVKRGKVWGFINTKGEVLGGKWFQNAELFVNTKL
tara:strand:- start:430 stop:1569 length:1140 start_codon:yes stop_codon:yes gene_type:complete